MDSDGYAGSQFSGGGTGAFADDTGRPVTYTVNMTIERATETGGVLSQPSSGPHGDETYLDTPYLSIRWRSTPRILYAEWKGFASSSEFRSALLTGVRAIREHKVVGYVSGHTSLGLAISIFGSDAYLIMILGVLFLPETRGQHLEA